MTHRAMQAALAGVTLILAIAFTLWVVTGTPLRWTKGVVIPSSCTPMAGAYTCQVELIPSGEHVTARSDTPIAGGDAVALRVWHDMVSATDTYTVVISSAEQSTNGRSPTE